MISSLVEILAGGPCVTSLRCEGTAGIGVGPSVAVALSETLCCSHQSCQGDALPCSERAESEQGCPRSPRMPSGRAVCLQAMESAAARPGVGGPRVPAGGAWAKPWIHSPEFSQLVLRWLRVPPNP